MYAFLVLLFAVVADVVASEKTGWLVLMKDSSKLFWQHV
jgi:hypothetical protein